MPLHTRVYTPLETNTGRFTDVVGTIYGFVAKLSISEVTMRTLILMSSNMNYMSEDFLNRLTKLMNHRDTKTHREYWGDVTTYGDITINVPLQSDPVTEDSVQDVPVTFYVTDCVNTANFDAIIGNDHLRTLRLDGIYNTSDGVDGDEITLMGTTIEGRTFTIRGAYPNDPNLLFRYEFVVEGPSFRKADLLQRPIRVSHGY